MPGDLSPDETRALVTGWGSTQKAAVAAMRLPEYKEEFRLIAAQLEKAPDGTVYPKISPGTEVEFWRIVAAALLGDALDAEEHTSTRRKQPTPKRSARGRRNKAVSVLEANTAAAIYAENPTEYDARDDGGAYAVHVVYVEDRDGPALLSRPMIGHLIDAIREGWLPWDARKGRLRISDEFRTSRTMFVIPRRKPAP